MIFITDELGKFEKNIIELAENVGFKECKTIEAIDLFCGISERNDVLKEKDRYYAFIDIPQYWSVRADGLNGAIYDNKTKKANIYFKNPIEKRMVSRVEWIDRNNTVYKVDYYNKYGYMYCSENVSGGNVTVREFYDRNGDIKVLEQTGPKTYTTFGTRISPKSYRGFADYLEAYLKYNKIYDENIWLTSDEILNKFAWDYGNFKISYLPQNRLNSDLTVITQTNTAFRILCSEEQQVNWYKENSNYKCDRLYSYLENNKSKFGRKEAFIITESDQLEYIEQLINDFPEITFHIAASTIMSDKLTRLDINNNVELYPCITEQKRKELFERCDIYLDINHYRELYNAVNEAMVNNMIILAFDNTAHSKELYPMGNIFESSNYVKMKETLKNIITKSGKAGEPVEMRFTKAEYDSLEAVIEEVFASYVNLTRQNDNFFVAMHPLHIRVAEHVLKGKRIIATFFENRFDFTQTSLAADFLEHAENIITDSDYTTKLIMENLGAVNNKPLRLHITDIPPYDTRMDFGISSQLRVQNILVPVDGLTEDAFARIIKGLADYLTINDLARVHFFTRDASWGHEDAIKNDTVKLLDSMGYDSRLVTGDGEAALGFGGSGADVFAENELGDIEKTVEQRFFVDVCVDERDISKCINEQRVILDMRGTMDVFVYVTAISKGVPRISLSADQFLVSGKNGMVIDDFSDIGRSLTYYLDSFENWNQALVECYELGQKYTTSVLLKKWRKVLNFSE